MLSQNTQNKLNTISHSWNWDNFKNEDTGQYWKVLEALYCKLLWIDEGLKDIPKNRNVEIEEYQDIIKDTMKIIEDLQIEEKI